MHFVPHTKHTPSRLYAEQDGQCTYAVTLRCVSATIVAVEKQQVVHILSMCL